MPAAWPWHGRRASPPSVSGPVPQARGSSHKTPRPLPKTLAIRVSTPFRRRHTREREREGGGGEEPREKEDDATRSRTRRRSPPPGASPSRRPDRLHRRCCSPCTASTRRPHLSAASAPPSSAPTVSSIAAVPFLSPTAAGIAEEPFVEKPRHHPFPSGHRAVFLCRSPSRRRDPRSRRRHSAAASCREPEMPVPRARHGHAAALGCQDPHACVRTPPRDPTTPQPCLRHNLALHVHPRDTTATSHSHRGHAVEAFSRAPIGRCTHTHTRTRTCCTRSGLPHRIPRRPTCGTACQHEGEGQTPPAREEEKEESPAARRRRKEAQPTEEKEMACEGSEPSQLFYAPSRPAARAGLLSRRPSCPC
jgi:hypothetical protein